MTGQGLEASARAWIDGDPDPETRAELEEIVSRGDREELASRMAPLQFGTAGLRGVVGAGPGRMNLAVVIRVTRAVSEWLRATVADAATRPIVVGFDARRDSRRFAEAAAGVLAAAGHSVRFFPEPVPTPLVAFGQRQLSGIAAIVVTASHNPPEYNGYKLYAPNGVQIVPPADRAIAERLDAMDPANRVPRAEGVFGADLAQVEPVPETMGQRYLAAIDALRPRVASERSIGIAYTPLHGVGAKWVERALAQAGFGSVSTVPEQQMPDADFPTVRFPNPEEPGTLDRVLELARTEKADLVLANDPDADRLAVALPTVGGAFVPLTGNQIGLLLEDFLLETTQVAARPLVVSTVPSSPMAEIIASARGARFELCHTGFKWIENAALVLEREGGCRFVFGFEEALGYAAGRAVLDKDGISAALLFAELSAQCHARGESVRERLRALYRRYGLWVSAHRNIAAPGLGGTARIAEALQRLTASPPASLGGLAVASVTDYRRGAEHRPVWLGRADVVSIGFGARGRAVVRPSGTEPKLKLYVDIGESVDETTSVARREAELLQQADRVAVDLEGALGLSHGSES